MRLLVVGVVAAATLPPFTGGERRTDTASIRRYDASMVLEEDGTLHLDERIVVTMPHGKRGIFRIFDTGDPRRAGIEHPVELEEVTRNERSEPYTWVDSATGTRTLRIGDEDVYLDPGDHTYRIRSTTTDVLEPGDDGETWWWWDVVGGGWQMSMDAARVEVDLPVEPVRAECVMGEGEERPCDATVEARRLVVDAGALPPFTPVTVRVAFPADALPDPPAGDSPLETVLLSIAAALLAGALGFWLLLATREKEPGFPVLFEPPQGVGPALAARVLFEEHSRDDLQATLYALADRGVLRLEGDDERWTVRLLVDPSTVPLDHPERAVLDTLRLRAPEDAFVVSKTKTSGERVSKARTALRKEVDSAAAAYLHHSSPGMVAKLLGWISIAGVLAIVGFHLFGDSGWRPWPLLVGLATFAVVSMGMVFDPGVATKRTSAGRDLWSRAGGFARFLTTDSAESRFDAAKHLDWYPRYLPWALVFGSADAWARRFEEQGVAVPDPPWILWAGRGRYSASHMSTSFNAAITSAAAAYAASQSSSGGGGGGGFSGGSGGGGGGGGSW